MNAKLIVALDVPDAAAVTPLVTSLPAAVEYYKVGLELYTAEGPAVVNTLRELGKQVFLDLKLHDIPRTVARAVAAAAQHDVALLTVHASGGRAMLEAAAGAAREAGGAAPRIIAVTALTSLDSQDLAEQGIQHDVAEHARVLGGIAVACGVDGLVCSPLEAEALRSQVGPGPLLVTPGIRPPAADVGDQKRVATPRMAVRAGSSFLVVGRPILEADDPAAATEAILEDMRQASS